MRMTGSSRLRPNAEIRGAQRWSVQLLRAGLVLVLAGQSVLAGAAARVESAPGAPPDISRVLASNLKGDELLWIGERTEDGQRFITTVVRYRQPTPVLEIADAVLRADLQVFDCPAQTRTLAGVKVYRFVEGTVQVALERDVPPAERRPTAVFGAGADGMVQAAFRAACSVTNAQAQPAHNPWLANGSPLAPAEPAGSSAPPGLSGMPGSPGANPGAPNPTPSANLAPQEFLPGDPAEPVSAGAEQVPDPAREPQGSGTMPPKTGTGALDQPVFADSVFTLRTLAMLADYVYLTESDIAKEQATVDYLRAAADVFASRGAEGDNYRKGVTEAAFKKAQREARHDLQRLSEKKWLVSEQGLQQLSLPKMRQAFPSFRAELFKQPASGQHVLVFRGSAEVYDWISNLWLGIDLGQVESPHYAAARELVGVLVKQGIRPLVIGHSLGGGMAQYVAHSYGLKVVAFNSSPLPERYLPRNGQFNPDHARIYSALEMPINPAAMGQADARTGDPVSLKLAQLAKWAGRFGDVLKTSHHLVAPSCVLSLPQPYRNEIEDGKMADMVSSMFVNRPLLKMLTASGTSLAKDGAVGYGVTRLATSLVDDPIWTSRDPAYKEAGQEARKRVAKVVIAQLEAAKGALQLGKWIFRKDMGKTALEMANGLAEAGAAAWVRRMLEVHSMERFVRGLGAYGDTSPYKAASNTEGPCGEVLSVY